MAEGLRQQANDPSHQLYIHPRRFLADKDYIARARCSQDEHVANEEGVFVPNDELWQNGLNVSSITHQRNMRQVRPSPTSTNTLYGLVVCTLP